jgi:hypothetical protein
MASFVLLQPRARHCRAARVQKPEALDDATQHAMKQYAMKHGN